VGQVEPIFHMLFNILAVSFLAKVDGHFLLFGSMFLQIVIAKLFDIKLNSIGLQKQPLTKNKYLVFSLRSQICLSWCYFFFSAA
jgi:hypothetical protein